MTLGAIFYVRFESFCFGPGRGSAKKSAALSPRFTTSVDTRADSGPADHLRLEWNLTNGSLGNVMYDVLGSGITETFPQGGGGDKSDPSDPNKTSWLFRGCK